MKHVVLRWAAAVAFVALSTPRVGAEEAARALPTLLIKGEVVSLDTNDPEATLLKVKDRYGFETPIYLTTETKIAQGDQAMAAADLKEGTPVEVEYNFDINTAKRHGVSVMLGGAASVAPASASPSTPPAPEASMAAPVALPADEPAPALSEPATVVTPEQPTEPAAQPQ